MELTFGRQNKMRFANALGVTNGGYAGPMRYVKNTSDQTIDNQWIGS
jgi:hypothetical protein